MADRVKQILSWYASDNPGTLTNLVRLLNHGTLAGTGKLVILPVDQGFEHGPARSFAPNPDGYDPDYHFQLAIDSGCNAYAAPLGFARGGRGQVRRPGAAHPQAQQQRLARQDGRSPISALTGSVRGRAAPRLRRPSATRSTRPRRTATDMYEDLREITLEAKRSGLVVVVWSYPRGAGISQGRRDGDRRRAPTPRTIAAQLGAHIIKVKPPTAHIEQDEAKKVYEKYDIPIDTLAERVRHVVQARSTASASSSSPAARPRAPTRCSRRCRQTRRRRRVRLDHGPQRVPAPARRSPEAARRRDGDPSHDVAELT